MSKDEFAYWLQGWVELNEGKMPAPAQWKMIVEHLNLAFNKVTPPIAKVPQMAPIKNGNPFDYLDLSKMPINDLGKVPHVPYQNSGYPLPYLGDMPSRNNILC